MQNSDSLKQDKNIGFGTFKGVFVPNVTMMFGVILFLRLGLVVGNVGIWQFGLIIALALTIMVITSLSIAMVVTNMTVGGGGAYYLISRSLGIEIGGAIGLTLVISQLISLTLCTSGFAYSFVELFPSLNIALVEVATLAILALLAVVSADFALRTQTLIFCILFTSIGAVFVASQQPPLESMTPYFPTRLTFWQGFAMFYPALTGIEAGMAMSGNLKNPSRSLSIGNVWSVVLVAVTYFSIAVFLFASYDSRILDSMPLVLIKSSRVPYLIYLGIWSAALSSSLGNLIGGPRMLQMIAEDGIVPEIFSREYGKHKEPRYAIGLVFVVAVLLVLFTTIDQIIPILTMFCLLTYGILNFVAGMAELIHSPTWRPSIRYPWQLCMFGAFLCFFVMLMINPMHALTALAIVLAVYLTLRRRSLEVTFKDFRDSIIFFFSRIALYKLSEKEEHAITWHPQALVISRSPEQVEKTIYLASAITKRSGLLSLAAIVPEVWEETDVLDRTKQTIQEWLSERGIESLVEVHAQEDYYQGICNLIKSYGIGSLQPNSIFYTVSNRDQEELEGLVQVMEAVDTYSKNILLFFNTEGVPVEDILNTHKPRVIDLWWDPDHRENFELMLSYILALRTSPAWKDRVLNLWSIAPDKTAKKHLEKHLKSLFRKIRMKIKVKIAVESEGDAQDFIKKYSAKADLVFFPLRPFSDYPETYRDYLETLMEKVPDSVPLLAVCSCDQVDHREIYLP